MKSLSTLLLMIILQLAQAQSLILRITNPQVTGNRVTYDVVADHFTEILTLQYVVNYDPEELSFVRTQNWMLLGMYWGNFDSNTPGVISMGWVDHTLEGTTLPNGSLLYQIVFDMLLGTHSSLCFELSPETYEILAGDQEFLDSLYVADDCNEDPILIDLTMTQIHTPETSKVSWVENPVDRNSDIRFFQSQSDRSSIRLTDITGRVLHTVPYQVYDEGMHSISVPSIPPGAIYILQFQSALSSIAYKILVLE